MIEEIGVDVMWFGPWCIYTLLITLLVLVNKNDKRGMKMDNPNINKARQRGKRLMFRHFYPRPEELSLISREVCVSIDNDRLLYLSYMNDGQVHVGCKRYCPIYVHIGMRLAHPSRQMKRMAIDYVIMATNETLQYSDIN